MVVSTLEPSRQSHEVQLQIQFARFLSATLKGMQSCLLVIVWSTGNTVDATSNLTVKSWPNCRRINWFPKHKAQRVLTIPFFDPNAFGHRGRRAQLIGHQAFAAYGPYRPFIVTGQPRP
jgi:hypothetical protein